MYTVIPWLDRVPENDYTFPDTNVTVKKGTPLILPAKAIHMDPKYYPAPEKFCPERFLGRETNSMDQFTYFPFGQGPRNCVGKIIFRKIF